MHLELGRTTGSRRPDLDEDRVRVVVLVRGDGQRGGLRRVVVRFVVPGPFGPQPDLVERRVVGDQPADDDRDAGGRHLRGEIVVVAREHGGVAGALQVEVPEEGRAALVAVRRDAGVETELASEHVHRGDRREHLVVGRRDHPPVALPVVQRVAGGGVADDDTGLGVGQAGVGEDGVDPAREAGERNRSPARGGAGRRGQRRCGPRRGGQQGRAQGRDQEVVPAAVAHAVSFRWQGSARNHENGSASAAQRMPRTGNVPVKRHPEPDPFTAGARANMPV
jgi:hypothetical protein